VEKLMIGQINHKYRMFMDNTGGINTVELTFQIRKEFQNHFGEATDYLKQQFDRNRKMHNGQSYNDKEIMCHYFKLEGFKAAVIDFTQDHTQHKGRDYQVNLISYDDYKERTHMVPFIRFYCNPIGIYLLEKIWFRSL